jgi:hypothetical protein
MPYPSSQQSQLTTKERLANVNQYDTEARHAIQSLITNEERRDMLRQGPLVSLPPVVVNDQNVLVQPKNRGRPKGPKRVPVEPEPLPEIIVDDDDDDDSVDDPEFDPSAIIDAEPEVAPDLDFDASESDRDSFVRFERSISFDELFTFAASSMRMPE